MLPLLIPTVVPEPVEGPLTSHLLPLTSYYGSALLIGLGNGHMWPAFQNMTINVAHNNRRGTANSTILVSWDLGMGLGILVGGIVAELLGYGLRACSIAALASLLIVSEEIAQRISTS